MKVLFVTSLLLVGLSGFAYVTAKGVSSDAESAKAEAEPGVRATAPTEPAVRPPSLPSSSRFKVSLPESASKSEAPAAGPLPADADVRVQLATLSRARVAKREEELAKVLARLGKAISAIGGTADGDAHEMAMEEFLKLVTLQRKMADEVLAGYEQFKKAMASYRKDLERAPEAYRQAAGFYRERASAEESERIRANYAHLADNCEAYARLINARRAELEKSLAEVAETVAYVKKTATFLKDFEDFLRLTPGIDTSSARRDYRQQLKVYQKAFTAFQELFLEFSRKLKAQAISDSLSGRPGKSEEEAAPAQPGGKQR